MLQYNDNTSNAYDIDSFDVDLVTAKKRKRPPMKVIPFSVSRSGNILLISVCLIVVAALLLAILHTQAKGRRIASERSEIALSMELSHKERSDLEAGLAAKVTTQKVEEFAENDLGLVKINNSEVIELNMDVDPVAEVAPREEKESVFEIINARFLSVWEFLNRE